MVVDVLVLVLVLVVLLVLVWARSIEIKLVLGVSGVWFWVWNEGRRVEGGGDSQFIHILTSAIFNPTTNPFCSPESFTRAIINACAVKVRGVSQHV
jgi:hypothetical protein